MVDITRIGAWGFAWFAGQGLDLGLGIWGDRGERALFIDCYGIACGGKRNRRNPVDDHLVAFERCIVTTEPNSKQTKKNIVKVPRKQYGLLEMLLLFSVDFM